MTVTIYCLCDPVSGNIRYVGKTIDTKARMAGHMSDARHVKRNAWIRSLRTNGLTPVMEELELVENSNDADWQSSERWWISYLRFLGCDLCNLDSGGVGGKRHSAETKKKIADSKLGRPLTVEHRAKLASAKLGTHRTQAIKLKISRSLTGVPKSPEHILAAGRAQIGKRLSPESIAKRTASRYANNKPKTTCKLN